MKSKDTKWPRPCWWPEPVTDEQYAAFAPPELGQEKGFLFTGPDAEDRRMRLLALLLRNCGLESAVRLADSFLWKEALERWELYGGYVFEREPYTREKEEV